MDRPLYINWIVKEADSIIKDNISMECYLIDYKDDDDIIDEWALHIRRNYIDDNVLTDCVSNYKVPVEHYLRQYIIPQRNEVLGPSARSGDICEIIVSDLLEFVFDYSVPRYKLMNRSGKNNSEHGTDVIAYKFHKEDKTPNKNDELIAAEVKGTLSKAGYESLENAITDSVKDEYRLSRTIDYCRKRLKELRKENEAHDITRFLMKAENDYQIIYTAAGISSQEVVDPIIELSVSGEELHIRQGQKIFFLHGKKLMELTHKIYERCIK